MDDLQAKMAEGMMASLHDLLPCLHPRSHPCLSFNAYTGA